jgi:hypothetical protein
VGDALSSAILYFAIVAIWAGILMPRWLRPSAHRHRAEEEQHEAAAPEAMVTFAQPGLEAGDHEHAAARAAEHAAARAAQDDAARAAEHAAAQAAQDDERAAARAAEADERAAARAAATAAARRANILRARRRMLTTLVLLTLGAFGIAVTHVAAWWVVVPPGVLLAGFLLLLREAARSDAARTRRLAHGAEAAQHRPPTSRPAEPEAFERITSTPEAPQPEAEPTPSAEIIDISARVNDQVYDQYTDAAERAVGD